MPGIRRKVLAMRHRSFSHRNSMGVLVVGLTAAAMLRGFGVPIAFDLWRVARRNQSHSKGQKVWGFGVFSLSEILL